MEKLLGVTPMYAICSITRKVKLCTLDKFSCILASATNPGLANKYYQHYDSRTGEYCGKTGGQCTTCYG